MRECDPVLIGDQCRALEDEGKAIPLQTYLWPGQNGDPSRCDTYLALAGPVREATKDSASYSRFFDSCAELVPRLRNESRFDTKVPFLRKPYESRDNPLDTVWAAARAGLV